MSSLDAICRTDRLLYRLSLSIPFIIAVWLIHQCPCNKVPLCHINWFYASVVIGTFLVWFRTQRS